MHVEYIIHCNAISHLDRDSLRSVIECLLL